MNSSVFLLLGPEAGEKDRFIKGIKQNLEKKAGGNLESYSYYPYETSMADVVSGMRNGSLFSQDKLVRIGNVEDLKKEGLDALTDYCANPAEGVTLLLLSDEIKISERLQKLIPKANRRIFWELFENQKQGWINSFFREQGMEIHPDALELLLDLVDNNTLDLKEACQRLALSLASEGDGYTVSPEDVESRVLHSKEENVFSLFAKIAAGELQASLDICTKLIESGSGQAVGILGGLVWQFRRLHTLRLMLDSNFSLDDALARTGIKGKRNGQIYSKGCETYSAEELGRILALQARYDGLLRSTPSEAHQHLLGMFLYYTASRKGLEEEPVFT